MNNHLEMLGKLTEGLPAWNGVRGEPYTILKIVTGEIFMFGLHKEPAIAVSRAFATAGTVHGDHVHHKEVEVIIVYKGELWAKAMGEQYIIKPGESLRLEQDTVHNIEFPVDTWMLMITVPASEDFPPRENSNE